MILDTKEQTLRYKSIHFVKELWKSCVSEEMMWEHETEMWDKYPKFFDSDKELDYFSNDDDGSH